MKLNEALDRSVQQVLLRMERLAFSSDAEPSSPDAEQQPEQIGPYKILHLLGQGGMGSVYAARQLEPFEREVAIKLIKPGMDSVRVLGRFSVEYQTLARLQHPNIAAIYDAGTWQGRPYFVMEFLGNATDLGNYCQTHKPDLKQLLRLFSAICDGIAYAHSRGILHRDIKPSNLMVLDHSTRPEIKIIDFGIAKALHHPIGFEQGLVTQAPMGTPAFMAPEQIANQPQDVRTDVFALGATLSYIFKTTSAVSMGRTGSRQAKEVAAIIANATAHDPNKRYPMVVSLKADLDRVLDGRAITALSHQRWYRISKWLTYRWRGASLIMLLTLLAGLGVGEIVRTRRALKHELAATKEALQAAHTAKETNERASQLIIELLNTVDQTGSTQDIEKLGELRAWIEAHLNKESELYISIQTSLANVFAYQDRYAEANQILDSLLAHPPKDEAALLTIRECRAFFDYQAGNLASAKVGFEALFAHLGNVTSLDPPLHRRIIREYAEVCLTLGNIDRAAQLIAMVVPKRDQIPITESEMAMALLIQGHVFREQSNLDEAEKVYRIAWKALSELQGETEPDPLNALENLGLLHDLRGQYPAAEKVLTQVLQGRVTRSGPNSARTALTRVSLGSAYFHAGNLNAAYHELTRAYDALIARLGQNHFSTLNCLHNLAAVEAHLGHTESAIGHFQTVLEKSSTVLGPAQDLTLKTTNNLGACLSQAQRLTEAELVLEAGLEAALTNRKPYEPICILLRCSLAENLLAQGRYQEAADHFQQLIKLASQSLEADHPYHALFSGLYGLSLAGGHKTKEAIPFLQRALKGLPAYMNAYRQSFEAELAKLSHPEQRSP